jgi:arylsulfatase A-like enzyme
MDVQIGRVVAALEAKARLDDTRVDALAYLFDLTATVGDLAVVTPDWKLIA